MTPTDDPARRTALPRSSRFPESSTQTVIVASRANPASRRSFPAPTTSLATKTSWIPPATMASASETVCTQTPTAPRSSCIRAMVTLLWVLTWGLRATPAARAATAIRSRLRSSASRSTTRAGVSRSASHRPGDGTPDRVIDTPVSISPVRPRTGVQRCHPGRRRCPRRSDRGGRERCSVLSQASGMTWCTARLHGSRSCRCPRDTCPAP